MLRKFFMVAAVALIPSLVSTANAQFKAGDYELTLSGTGGNNRGFTNGSFGGSGSFGYFFTNALELSLRQSATYSHPSGSSDQWTASTRGALDYHFDLGRFQPFVGANIGYAYGTRGFTDSWEVAPEAGIKYFLNSTTFVFGMAEYQIYFRSGHGAAFNRGSWVYTLGLGLRL